LILDKEYLKHIGRRLRIVRSIFNEGSKLSTEQFAYLLGESRDNIANYEHARASVPVRVLLELYCRGINPTWIITGEGSIFADNEAGRLFRNRLELRNINISEIIKVEQVKYDENQAIGVLKVAAGRIRNKGSK